MPTFTRHKATGFTLVEVLIGMGVFVIIMGLILARYNRGSDDSVLTRQAAMLVADIRFAQESTASGLVARTCTADTGTVCASNANCAAGESCQVDTVAAGGFGVLFTCPNPAKPADQVATSALGATQYVTVADSVACGTGEWCFPPAYGTGAAWTWNAADGVASVYDIAGRAKGDPRTTAHTLLKNVVIQDIQLTEATSNATVRCGQGSPWNGKLELEHSDIVPADYPLQALIRFLPPGGREVVLNDNISDLTVLDATRGTQGGKAWSQLEVMLGMTTRVVDCRVVRVTSENLITQYTDANCSFSS